MIPFVDLKAQYRTLKQELGPVINNVLASGAFTGGENVESLEKEFAAFCGARYAVGVANGTDALFLGLKALGIGAGDEVITVPNTFIATVEAITLAQAKPVFVDIDEKTYNIDPGKIAEKITKRTKAIIPVHLYGQPADLDRIYALARKYGLTVIEDACQAHGARYKGKRIGAKSRIACFSFYPSKNLGACGDGGMIVTDKEAVSRKLKMFRDHGQIKKYKHEVAGINSRLDALQAAILRIKLGYLEAWNEKRRENAAYYNTLLSRVKGITIPYISPGVRPVFHIYAIQTDNRDGLQQYLQKNGISTAIHYPIPVHLQKAYRYLGHKKGDFPIAEKAARHLLSLPMYPELELKQIDFIAAKIKSFTGGN